MFHPVRFRSPPRQRRHLPAPALAWLVLAALLVLALPSHAQDRASSAAPTDALDARAAVPALRHAGSLSTYRRLDGAKPLAWDEANATVGRIGGWRAYAREAARPEPAASAPAGGAAATPSPTAPAAAGQPHRH